MRLIEKRQPPIQTDAQILDCMYKNVSLINILYNFWEEINHIIVVASYIHYINRSYRAYYVTVSRPNWNTKKNYVWRNNVYVTRLVWTKWYWNARCTWIASLYHTSNHLCWLSSLSFRGSEYGPGFLFSQLRLKIKTIFLWFYRRNDNI